MLLSVSLLLSCSYLSPWQSKLLLSMSGGLSSAWGGWLAPRDPAYFSSSPLLTGWMKVDLRVVTMDVPSQDVITRDNVTLRVDAVVYFRVVDPESSVVKVLDHIRATSLISQTTLRNVLGQSELDELLTQREKLNQMLQKHN